MTAALATFDQPTGHPYASLVLVATSPDATPLLLLSQLARHTCNLRADARASLLFDGTRGSADPLAGGRTTLLGRIDPVDDPNARRRFLSRHPAASAYADFQDFALYAMTLERAHYIGGFGRIVALSAADVLIETGAAQSLVAAEPDIVGHMNAHHADAVALYATRLLGEAQGDWRMAGLDPEGADLLSGGRATRLLFRKTVATPDDARAELVDLANAARLAGAISGAFLPPREGLT